MDTVNDTNPPTDSPPPYARPDRLTRATDDKVVGGVAGGLGRYFGIDPVVFRIAFVVLALAGGSGILLYLLAWLLVPDDTGSVALPRLGSERNQKLLTAVLVGGGLLILIDQFGNRGHGDVPVGLVLVALGALVLWSRRDGSGDSRPPYPPAGGGGGGRYVASTATSPPPPAPPVPPAPEGSPEAFGEPPLVAPADTPDDSPAGPPADSADDSVADPAAGAPTVPLVMSTAPPSGPVRPSADPVAAASPRARKEPKPRSVLVPATFSLLAVLAGGLALVGVSAATGLALALLVTGGALVVGAWRGRGRWLIPVGLVLAVALAAASIVDVPVRGGTGDARFAPTTPAAVRTPYRLAAGNMTLDLGALDLGGTTVTVVASVAAGNLRVVVPAGVAVDLDAHAGAGNLRLFGHEADGLDVERQASEPGRDGAGRLVLRVRAGFGQVEVERAAA
jgi:phage shock protein PspC (stress-responsive transcriptional regulator)